MADIETLKARARVIQNETGSKRNTASRVGGLLLDIIDSLSEAGAKPNNEDLNVDANGKLQLANRSVATNQKGYKILREGVALSSQMADANTIYEVRYNFDLNSGTLAIPLNCKLFFNGGRISNGTIVFNNTMLSGSVDFSNCTCSGTLVNEEVDVTWFGADPTGTNDCSSIIANLLSFVNKIFFPDGTFVLDSMITLLANKSVRLGKTTLTRISNNTDPILWLYGNAATIVGIDRFTSIISTPNDSPFGVVRLGFENENDVTVKNILHCRISNVRIKGKAAGGNQSGDWDIALYMVAPFLSVYAASYFHTIDNIVLENANIGLLMKGDCNANQFSNLFVEQCDNRDLLQGASIYFDELTNTNNRTVYPVDNSFNGVFFHTAHGSVSIRIAGGFMFNSIRGVISEPGDYTSGGTTKRSIGLIAVDKTTIASNVVEFLSNNSGGNSVSTFAQRNVLIYRTSMQMLTLSCQREYIGSGVMSVAPIYTGLGSSSVTKVYKFMTIEIAAKTFEYRDRIKIRCNTATRANYGNRSAQKEWVAEYELSQSYNTTDHNAILTFISGSGDAIPVPRIVDNTIEFYFCVGIYASDKVAVSMYIDIYSARGSFSKYNVLSEVVEADLTTIHYQYVKDTATTSIRNNTTSYEFAVGQRVFDTDLNKSLCWTGTSWVEQDNEVANIRRSGTFAQKPTPANVGFVYFNTDTHKPMTWDGSNWYYADGTQATS